MTQFDPAAAIAEEHIAWAKEHGLSATDLLRGIGWLCPMNPTWEHVSFALQKEWRRLRDRKPIEQWNRNVTPLPGRPVAPRQNSAAPPANPEAAFAALIAESKRDYRSA